MERFNASAGELPGMSAAANENSRWLEFDSARLPRVALIQSHNTPAQQLWVGIDHFSDPKNPQYVLLQGLWRYFRLHGGTHAIHEGWKRDVFKSEETALKSDNEPAWLTYVATRDGIPLGSGEVPMFELAVNLISYTENVLLLPPFRARDLVALHISGRLKGQLLRVHQEGKLDVPPDIYVHNKLKRSGFLVNSMNLGLDFRDEHLEAVHSSECPDIPFDPMQPRVDGSICTSNEYISHFFPPHDNPEYTLTPLQRLGRYDRHTLCNDNLVSLSSHQWNKGRNVFFLYGGGYISSHVDRIVPRLPDAFGADPNDYRITWHIGTSAVEKLVS